MRMANWRKILEESRDLGFCNPAAQLGLYESVGNLQRPQTGN